VRSAWTGGFVADVTVGASSSITGWRVTMNLPSGTTVTNLWNGVANAASGTVVVTNQSYNGSVAAGGSTSFGFQGGGSSSGITVSCTPA
jgi:hypothetical protein